MNLKAGFFGGIVWTSPLMLVPLCRKILATQKYGAQETTFKKKTNSSEEIPQ